MSQNIDWPFWKAMRTVKLWQACALIAEIDPDSLKQDPAAWMAPPGAGPIFDRRCFPDSATQAKLDKAIRLAETAVSYMNGPIVPQGAPHPGSNWKKDVLLQEVVMFFASLEWLAIPAELQSTASAAETQKHQETKEQRQDRRLAACRAAGLTMGAAARWRLPDGVGDVADAEGVTRQAFSADVKEALKREYGER